MSVQRCPECGQRLKTNYCDICMRKVPFAGVRQVQRRDPWDRSDGSSAHRMEKGHTCVSFEKEDKPFRKFAPKVSTPNPKRVLQILAIVIALMIAVFEIGGVADEIESVAVPEPAANVSDGFVSAGDLGAEDVPDVISEEIYNADGIRITVDDAGLSYGEYTILLTIQNETDRKIEVGADLFSVNGYMYPYGMYHEVKAGRSEQIFLTFYSEELEKSGIEKVRQVSFVMDICEAGDYENIVTGELLTIETDYIGSLSAATEVYGMPLYNDTDLTIILQDVVLRSTSDCELKLYFQNHSRHVVDIYSGMIWINGEETSGFVWQSLLPDTCAVSSTYIYDYDLEDLQITGLDQIEKIAIDLYIDYMDGMDILKTVSQTITIVPNAID